MPHLFLWGRCLRNERTKQSQVVDSYTTKTLAFSSRGNDVRGREGLNSASLRMGWTRAVDTPLALCRKSENQWIKVYMKLETRLTIFKVTSLIVGYLGVPLLKLHM